MTDLRFPTGILFAILGLLLTAAGALADYRARLATVNVNLYAGAAMLAFAGVLLWLSRGSQRG
jgi:hypothetical protein